jgi:hypothetical protein
MAELRIGYFIARLFETSFVLQDSSGTCFTQNSEPRTQNPELIPLSTLNKQLFN